MKLEIIGMGVTILGWIALLVWLINILFTHHDHMKQSIIMKALGWLGVILILVGGGINYAYNQTQDITPAATPKSKVTTNDTSY